MEFVARPKVQYKEKIVKALQDEFNYSSIMEVPKLSKIVLSQGIGDAINDKKLRIEKLSVKNL